MDYVDQTQITPGQVMMYAHSLCPANLTYTERMEWMANYFIGQMPLEAKRQPVRSVDDDEFSKIVNDLAEAAGAAMCTNNYENFMVVRTRLVGYLNARDDSLRHKARQGYANIKAHQAVLAERDEELKQLKAELASIHTKEGKPVWTMEELVDYLEDFSKVETYRLGLTARVLGMAIRFNPPNEAFMFQIRRLQAMMPQLYRDQVQRDIDWHEKGREPIVVRPLIPS